MVDSGHPTTSPGIERAPAAFDPRRPPDPGLIDECVHCGFCLPTCPTYVLWGEEMDSPRGRIVLMKEGLEEADHLSSAMVTHFDRCLGCMACVTACPSGVRYDRLIEATRPQVERNHDRPLRDRVLRRLLLGLFGHPQRLRTVLPLLTAARRAGLLRAVQRIPGRGRWLTLRTLAALAPDVPRSAARARVPERLSPRGAPRARVGLLQGCVQRVFFHPVNAATQRVLLAEGFEVDAPASVRCCGALLLHSGYEDDALARARDTIAGLESCDYVVVNAAGCGSAMKEYGHLLADDPAWAERAAAFSGKVRDVTELLTEFEPRAPRRPLPARVAYHDACHLAHAQRVRAQPRALLAAIPGLDLVEPDEWEICCGSAGVYNLWEAEAAAQLGRRKAANLTATRADAIAAGNPGCALQIAAHLERGSRVPVMHTIELIDASISGRGLGASGAPPARRA